MHLPLVGRYAQRAFLSKMEDIAVMALAFCHSHEITLRDLETYGVLQASPMGAMSSMITSRPNPESSE